MAADVTGCSLPANTSKKSRFEAGCNCESDELARAGVCGFGQALGSLRCAEGKAGVRAVCPGPCDGEHLLAAYYGTHVGERALVISATARLVAPANLSTFICSAPLCLGLWRRRGSFGFPLAFLGGA